MTLEQILQQPEHPLHALNSAYQAYCKAVLESSVLENGHASLQTRVAYYKDALAYYREEERKVKAQGLHFCFIKLPFPWCGYFDLMEFRLNDAQAGL